MVNLIMEICFQIASLAEQMNELYPLEKLDERRQRRDRALMELAKLKKNHNLQ